MLPRVGGSAAQQLPDRACISGIETLPREAVARDRALRSVEGGGELGALRYCWCVELGVSYASYARAVGVTRGAVWLAVRGHAERTGKSKRAHRLREARTTPRCPDCGETELEAFYRCESRPTGYQTYCKACERRRYSAGRAGRARATRRRVRV
jgi:hypothetical protein